MTENKESQYSLPQLMTALGFTPYEVSKQKLHYYSPLVTRRTRSFYILPDKNTWFDVALSVGGGPLDFACRYLEKNGEDATIVDGERWLKNLLDVQQPAQSTISDVVNSGCRMIREEPVSALALLRLLQNKGIDLKLAKQVLVEATVRNPADNRIITALALKNEEGGFELFNALFKDHIAPRSFTFMRGCKTKPDHIHIFRNAMDYLTFLTIQNGKHSGDAIVLNFPGAIDHIMPFVKGYGYKAAFTWMANSKAGQRATGKLQQIFNQTGLNHRIVNPLYAGFETLNDWHVYNLHPKQSEA